MIRLALSNLEKKGLFELFEEKLSGIMKLGEGVESLMLNLAALETTFVSL